MNRFGLRAAAVYAAAAALTPPAHTHALELNGFVAVEGLSYLGDHAGREVIARQSMEIGTHLPLRNGLNLDLRLYGSADVRSDGHSYVDPAIVQLSYQTGPLRLDVGYGIEYWGVAESRKIVNVINQQDQIRSLEGDMPLGQPMLSLRHYGENATIAGYVLPGFVPLDYGVPELRLGLPLPVDDSRATYDSAARREHVDYALRLSGHRDDLEYGLFVFDGTLRQPAMRLDASTGVLVPHYRQGRQFGLESQYTRGATLIKLEALHVEPDGAPDHQAAVYGIEHVVANLFGSPYELTLFAEHILDSRSTTLFQDDLFLGARLDFANTRGTTLTLARTVDLDNGGVLATAKLETRLTDSLKLALTGYLVEPGDTKDALYFARCIEQVRLALTWNF